MLHISNKKLWEQFVIVCIFIFVVTDFANKIYFRSHVIPEIAFGSYSRGLILLPVFLVFLCNLYLNIKISLSILAFGLVVLLGRYFSYGFENIPSFINSLGRYISLPLFLYVFLYVFDFNKSSLLKIAGFVMAIAVCSTFLSLLGLIFDIGFFHTYYGGRFGYTFFYYYANDATVFYVVATSISYFIYQRLRSRNYLFFTIFIIIGGMLVGTKGYWLFLTLLSVISLSVNWKATLRTFLILTPFIIITVILSYQYYYQKIALNGWSFTLSSQRNVRLETMTDLVFNNFTRVNFFLGTGEIKSFLTETDLLDLFLYSGLLGFCLYLYVLFSLLKGRPKRVCPLKWALIGTLLLISFLSGHVLGNGSNSLLLAFFFVLISREE